MMLLARASTGLILWAAGFSLLYALHGIGCEGGWDAALFRLVLVVAWLALIAANGTVAIWAYRCTKGFAGKLTLSSAMAGLVATIITGAPVAFFALCV